MLGGRREINKSYVLIVLANAGLVGKRRFHNFSLSVANTIRELLKKKLFKHNDSRE